MLVSNLVLAALVLVLLVRSELDGRRSTKEQGRLLAALIARTPGEYVAAVRATEQRAGEAKPAEPVRTAVGL